MTESRLKKLLQNALLLLEDITETSILDSDIEENIGITEEEYDEIMEN